MSKISGDVIRDAITGILAGSVEKKRNFLETVELQVGLKNYDPKKDKRFSGIVKLPFCPRPNLKICVLGDELHCDEAATIGVDAMSTDDLKKLKKNKKLVKKLAAKYAAFIASDTLIKQIPRLLGPGLNKAGKFPSLASHSEPLENAVNDVKSSIKFQLKKVICLGVAIGNVGMDPSELEVNIKMSINFLISLLKKQYQNVRMLSVKSTMGKSYRLY